MIFTDLNRQFKAPRDDEDDYNYLGYALDFYKSKSWEDLLKEPLVIVLASASSGKTLEFKQKTQQLKKDNQPAFFIAIEDLVEEKVEEILGAEDFSAIQRWRQTTDIGYFFLDSVDEAKLSGRKAYNKALRRFRRFLGDDVYHAHVYISSRPSDWRNKEDGAFTLDMFKREEGQSVVTADNENNDEIRLERVKSVISTRNNSEVEEENLNESSRLCVMSLMPLDIHRQEKLAMNTGGVSDGAAFIKAIQDNGLDTYSRRPGDLIALADYWNKNRQFDTFENMTEFGIERLLDEKSEISDTVSISDEKIRQGAERLAIALLLTKRLSILKENADGRAGDESPVNSKDILKDWTPFERRELLRRGIFAPASFGAVRFNHRSTIEYLAACWLFEQLKKESSREEIEGLIFQSAYDVETIATELRPVVGWLALKDTKIADRVMRIEPFELIRQGDPKSLPIDIRQSLLHEYCDAHLKGDVGSDSIEHRAVWSFSDKRMAEDIRECWDKNQHWSFRSFLMSIIREGEITDCVDLIESEVWREAEDAGFQASAIDCLKILGQTAILSEVGNAIKERTFKFQNKIGYHIAILNRLYPEYISTQNVLDIIRDAETAGEYSTNSFAYGLSDFVQKCPQSELCYFLDEVTKMAYSRPHKSSFEHYSTRYGYLTTGFSRASLCAIERLNFPENSAGLAKMIMGVQLLSQSGVYGNEKDEIPRALAGNRKLRRSVFLEDIRYQRLCNEERGLDTMDIPWRMFGRNHRGEIPRIDVNDQNWLLELVTDKSLGVEDREAAFYSLIDIGELKGEIISGLSKYQRLAQFSKNCQEWLSRTTTPVKKTKRQIKRDQKIKKNKVMKEIADTTNAQSWLSYRDELLKNLPVANFIESVPENSHQMMYDLTRFLRFKRVDNEEAATQGWRSLIPIFGTEITDCYVNHMTQIWRYTKPRRPTWKGNGVTKKWVNVWSMAGLGIEAKENKLWAKALTPKEAELACKHLFRSDSGIADWMPDIFEAYPEIAYSQFRAELKYEWTHGSERPDQLLSYLSYFNTMITPLMAKAIFSVILNNKAAPPQKWGGMANCLKRFSWEDKFKPKMFDLAKQLFEMEDLQKGFDSIYLSIMFLADFDRAIEVFTTYIEALEQGDRDRVIGALFSNRVSNNGILPSLSLSAADLSCLLDLCYRYIRIEDDEPRKDGVYTPSCREKAEDARGCVLDALLGHKSESAYKAIREFGERNDIGSDERWFKVLSKRMVEAVAMFKPWRSDQVYDFIKKGEMPIQTPEQFFELVLATLNRIQTDLSNEDFSLKKTVRGYKTEAEMQEWLGVMLREKLGNYASNVKEYNVADKKRADIVVIARGIEAEVVIELKHSDKGWTIKGFEDAITKQIIEKYLRVERRRHGILFISHHEKSYWVTPETKERIKFLELIKRLEEYSKKQISLSNEVIDCRVFGLTTS